jgi:hypothetical protein
MPRKVSKPVGCLVVFLGLAVVGGCMSMLGISGPETTAAPALTMQKIKVPNLKGKQLTVAQDEVSRLGLLFTQSGITPGSFCTPGESCLAYSMQPAPGTEVGPGAQVGVKFATAAEWAFYKKNRTMPKLIGWDDDRMGEFFEPIRPLVTTSWKESTAVPVGMQRVIAQSPKPGARLNIGQKVKLVIGVNYGTMTGGGGGGSTGNDTNVDVDIDRNGESKFCSKRWWC